MSRLNGAYSVEQPDDIIEPYASNGWPRVEAFRNGIAASLDTIPSSPFKDRVLDAISMLTEGFGRVDVQDKHGAVVYRQAKHLVSK